MIYSMIIIFLMIIYLTVAISTTFFANNNGKAEYEAEVIESKDNGSIVQYSKNGRSVYEEIIDIYPVGSRIIVKGYDDNLIDMVEVDDGVAIELSTGSFCAMLSCVFYLIIDYIGMDLDFLSFIHIVLAGFFVIAAGAVNGNLNEVKRNGKLIKGAILKDISEFKFSDGHFWYSPSYTYVENGVEYEINKQKYSEMRDIDMEIGKSYDIIYNQKIQSTKTVNAMTQSKVIYYFLFLLSVLCLILSII